MRNRKAVASEQAGEDVFRIACRNCHALDGYKGLRKSLTGMDERFVEEVAARLQYLRGKMPPFAGTGMERRALAAYLIAQTDQAAKPVSGAEVFSKRCNICHTIDGGYRALYPLLRQHTTESLEKRIPTLGQWQKKMVPYTGTEEETRMLAEYISSWYEKEDQAGKGER